MGPRLQVRHGAGQIRGHAVAVGGPGLGHGLRHQRLGRRHQRQVDDVTAHHGIVAPAVGIGQQLARRHVQRRQRGHAALAIVRAGGFEFDPALEHDLELDVDAVHLQQGADAVLVGAHLAGWAQRVAGSGDGTHAVRAGQALAQLAIALDLGDQKVDVDRLAIFAVAQRHGGIATEEAAVRRQHFSVQRLKDGRDAAVMRPLKQAIALRPVGPPGPSAVHARPAPCPAGRCAASFARTGSRRQPG
jgi:hypothetical protein